MLRAVEVTNHLGDSILLELDKPEKTGFIITNIDGLGPPEADINIDNFAIVDGGIFNSARIGTRNIVIQFEYLMFPDIETVRKESYRYFPIKKPVNLRFISDHRDVETSGYVESNEPIIFSDKAGAQISILCPDPYFKGSGPDGRQQVLFSGIEPAFEFPFGESEEEEHLIIFGNIVIRKARNVQYDGGIDTGILITINCMGPAEMITIHNVSTREEMVLDTSKIETITGEPLDAGDAILIDTVRGQRSIRLLRDGVYTNIFNALDWTSSWFQLGQGENLFAYTAESGELNLQFKMEYKLQYGGI